MADDINSTDQSNKDDLQILSSLLIKERTAEGSDKVKEILASDKVLKDKIALITALDNEQKKKTKEPESQTYLSRPKKKPLSPKKESDLVIDLISDEAAAEVRSNRNRLSQNRKKLKPMISRSGFFKYIFSERKKIRAFGSESGILIIKNFSTKIILNPLVLTVFPKNIQVITKQLLKSLKLILDNGWLYLEKRDYNLVVLLHKLCRELSLVDFSKFDPKSSGMIDRLASAELLFLILYNEPGDVKELLYAVDTVFFKDPSKQDLQKETSVNIHKLLDKDLMKPSLYNLIVGLNIIKTQTFLELEDLKNPSLQLIDNHDFNCTPKNRDKIDDYLRNLEKGIQPYLENEKEVYRLHAFIPTDGKGVVDYSLLQHFYDSVLHSRKLSFNTNKENIIKLILNLGHAFLVSFREVLSERVEVEGKKIVILFGESIFGQDIVRIEFNLGKLDKIQTILPKFATSRCLSIKKTMSGAIESEADAIHVIYEITSTIVAIGKRLAHILRNTVPQSMDNPESQTIPYFTYDESAYKIPYENQKLMIEGFLKGFTVRDALFQIAGVCYQTGAFVKHGELTDLLAKEKQIHDEIHIKAKAYKRIAHEKIYDAFLKTYNIPI